jgi:membrane protein YdbS with pleckstrin-like domain
MSAIKIECPHCQKLVDGDETLYGQKLKCPQCQNEFMVPEQPVAPSPKLARIVSSPSPAPVETGETADEETDVFRIPPAARAFYGALALGVALIGGGIGFAVLVPLKSWSGNVAWMALLPITAGFFCWLRVWIRLKSSLYRLTNQRLLVRQGILATEVNELELYRIKDVTVDQDFLGRILDYGTVVVISADSSTPRLELAGVARPIEIKETLRTQFRAARRREGMHPTEFIDSPKP